VTAPAEPKSGRGWELAAVLAVTYAASGLYALLELVRAELTVRGGIAATTARIVYVQPTTHPWLDFADRLADLLTGFAPALLALALLARDPGGRGAGIGLERLRRARDWLQGLGFCALIGVPGLALVYVAHRLGYNASIAAVTFPDLWYRIPYLLLRALNSGMGEEIVVCAYLLTRLRQLRVPAVPALLIESTLRGSYHLYQGYGGFAGNFVMGLIFGYWFQRTGRVVPLVVAHTLLDAISFIGYVYLHGHVSWI